MARDPPSLVSSSELRDLSLEPSDIRAARITIAHHQLRDLVLPIDRGHVLYPRGTSIEELRWSPLGEDEPGPSKGSRSGTTRTFARLSFAPNCLTATGPIMACGGQGGELYMTNLPSRTSSTTNLNARFPSSPPPIKPFFLSAVLPTMSINNSMIILPGWPGEWHKRERQRRAAFLRRHGPVDMDEESEDESTDKIDEEEVDEVMDLDDEEFDTGSSGFATYPNTVPFVHPPRIPHLSPATPSMEIPTTRRASSFSDPTRPAQPHRPSFSHSLDRPGLPPIQYVTSLTPGSSSMSSATGARRPSAKSNRSTLDRPKGLSGMDEPRLLISNNDQTIKMFSLPVAQSTSTTSRRASGSNTIPAPYARSQPFPAPVTSAMRRTVSGADGRAAPYESHFIQLPRLTAAVAPPPPPRFGSGLGWDSVSANEGLSNNRSSTDRLDRLDNTEMERQIQAARAQLRAERENRRRTREEFERVVGMRVGLGSGSTTTPAGGTPGSVENWGSRNMTPGERGEFEERKLAKVGGARFKCPVNHSSLSPDMKTLVSVGDSSEVYLLQVVDGGREFKRIGTYSAATDAGFSTSWSKDGRKFAVASQDGQVTVWDHRSSIPLAIFHTTSGLGAPSFTSDLSSARGSSESETDSPYQADRPNDLLVDPMTGERRSHRNENGKEPARVVKFSPEGSSRDLMVFSEDNANIHIVDARTFHTHVIVPVPWRLPGSSPDRTSELGVTGIAGLAFDPSGDWLYAGTERTVVEWDMRRLGGGESGTWQMA